MFNKCLLFTHQNIELNKINTLRLMFKSKNIFNKQFMQNKYCKFYDKMKLLDLLIILRQ